jgi:hypothetical protein
MERLDFARAAVTATTFTPVRQQNAAAPTLTRAVAA